MADAICDRLVHNAHAVTLRGGSMRKKKAIAPEVTETNTLERAQANWYRIQGAPALGARYCALRSSQRASAKALGDLPDSEVLARRAEVLP